MAIIQISKIQTRSGNLVDLPQLDNGEFGFASDENRLFIGRTGNTISSENIEVLTSYSNISFSQIDGSDYGNFNITTPLNGQILTYVSSTDTWENYTGSNTQLNGGKLQLGNVANISMGGGAIGYVLETDGLGNLSWTPKGTLYTPIKALSNANPIVMTVANTTPYTTGQEITISGVLGTNANTIVNGQNFYIALSNNFPTSGNVSLYTDVNRTIGANGATLTATANTGTATAVIAGSGGGGTGAAAGSQNSVQFNNGGILAGNSQFTYTQASSTLAVAGNVNTGNVTATSSITAPVLISNIATGTSPLTVTSTTRVANLNVSYSNVTDFTNITTPTTGNYYPVLTNALTGNVAQFANSGIVYNVATAGLTATLFTGTLTTNAQPNITSVGTLTSLAVTGNTTSGNFVGIFANGTSNISIPASAGNINMGVAGNAGILVVTGTGVNVSGTLNATGNITGNLFGPLANGNSNVRIATANGNVTISAVGNTILTVTGTGVNVAGTFNTGAGNANVGNIGVTNRVIANVLESTVATGSAPFTVASTTQVANLYATRANVSDLSTITAITTGTYYVPFISGTANANYALNSNTAFSANIANGAIIATTFVGNLNGNVIGNISGNVSGNTLTLTGRSNLNAVSNVYISGGTANQILKTDGSGNLSWTDPTGGYYLFTQSSASTTWTVVHNLNRQYVTVEPIDSNGNSYTGRYDFPTINYTNANALTITFQSAVAGWAAVVGGGLNIGNVSGNYSPAGVNTQVQFNDAGNMAGSSGLVYNKNTGTLTATLIAGSGANLTNIAGANVTGTVANATYATSAGTATSATSATTAGTVTTAAQPNITSVGTLTGLGINGTLTAVNITANSGLITGTLATNAQTNITSVGTLTSVSVTGNTTTGGIKTDNYYYANGVSISFAGAYSNSNVAAYLPTFTGTVGATVLTTGANTTAGTITGNWSLSAGSRLNSTYADLAEYYEADTIYEPGTVLEFGGEKEVTLATDETARVAGVVSTDPSYAMNTKCPGIAVAMALQGRVPTKVRGIIRKGDMMVSGGNGYARPTTNPKFGTIIGKALENFNGIEGVIEVAIGRL